MKDYLTSASDEFKEICKKVALNGCSLSSQQVDYINESCQIIATEKDNENWRNVRKQLILLWFMRDTNPIEDGIVRKMLDKQKELNCTKGMLFSSSGFTRTASSFAENRPIELVTKAKLESLLSKAGA